MPRGEKLQTNIEGFGFIYQPKYPYKGESRTSNVWWMEYKTQDEPVRRSTGQRDQKAAFAELSKIYAARVTGQIVSSVPERVLIGTLLDLLLEDYETKKTLYDLKCRVEKHIRPQWGDTRAVDLRKRDLKAWVAKLGKQSLTPGSINRCLANLHRAFKLGMEEDPPLVVRMPPFPWQDESNNVRQGILLPEHYRKLRDELIAHAKLALVIAYHVGLRRGAILSLRWEWFDWEARIIRIPPQDAGTKKKPREVPIYGEMLGFLEMAKSERDARYPECPWVIAEEGRRIVSFKTAWEAAGQRAGIPRTLFHDLRRTALTRMDEAGIPRAQAMAISGHKTESVYRRYLIGNTKQVQSVGRRMEEYMAEKLETAVSIEKPKIN